MSRVSDYPEHLNPFYEGDKVRFWKGVRIKRSNSIGQSFKNTLLLKSFRGTKKKEQSLKAISNPPAPRLYRDEKTSGSRERHTINISNYPVNVEVTPLPRSRFSERVAKSYSNGHIENCNTTSFARSETRNPFEEAVDGDAAKRKLRRVRKKKRAPLPPKSEKESEDLHIASDSLSNRNNLSEWSLVSTETDMSTYSESENLEAIEQTLAEVMNITEQLNKLTHVDDGDLLYKENREYTAEEKEALPSECKLSIDDNSNIFLYEMMTTILEDQIRVICKCPPDDTEAEENDRTEEHLSVECNLSEDIIESEHISDFQNNNESVVHQLSDTKYTLPQNDIKNEPLNA